MLSRSGVFAALLVGAAALGAGWGFVIVLLVFFISSTALSRYRQQEKENLHAGIVAKGNARDAFQVFANGGVFALACFYFMIFQNPAAIYMAVGAISAATADTWATEIGSLSGARPRSILTGRVVSAGTSGGITWLGSTAAVAGAIVVGVVGIMAGLQTLMFAIVSAGVGGALVDSLAGASVQSSRWCTTCSQHTERSVHLCGTRTSHASGLSWINNDVVNLFCTLAGAGIAALWVL